MSSRPTHNLGLVTQHAEFDPVPLASRPIAKEHQRGSHGYMRRAEHELLLVPTMIEPCPTPWRVDMRQPVGALLYPTLDSFSAPGEAPLSLQSFRGAPDGPMKGHTRNLE